MIKKIVPIVFLLFAGSVVYYYHAVANNKIIVGYNNGYEPTQPLPFSHAKHAGEFKIDCKFCHTSTETSRHASVPSLNICMNCHRTVKVDSPHIQKLTEAYENNEPIKWKKVHLLPDFVKFSHLDHVLAEKNCNECHGEVEKMSVVFQESSLSMGFCVNCHRKPENKAPTNCSTCHY